MLFECFKVIVAIVSGGTRVCNFFNISFKNEV